MCRTYGFHKLVPEELDIGEEDGRGYPEDLYPLWFEGLRRENKGDSEG